MKASHLAVAILGFSGFSALAADVPAPVTQRIYIAAPIWNGAFLGVQAGYGQASSPIGLYAVVPPNIAYDKLDPKGFFGGVHAGYNFQFGGLVLGAVADAELASLTKHKSGVSIGPVFIPAPEKVNIGWNASLRARVGYAVLPDLLIYATGGMAFANMEILTTFPAPATVSKKLTGWTIGAGAAYALTRGVSASLEYRYTSFGKFERAVAPPFTARTELDTHALRAGLSFRLGG